MRCIMKDWRGQPREMDLASALEPTADYDGGSVEAAASLARKNAECIGRLAALLVERRVITLDEATEVCGIYSSLELKE